jgi:hypothetical protein
MPALPFLLMAIIDNICGFFIQVDGYLLANIKPPASVYFTSFPAVSIANEYI